MEDFTIVDGVVVAVILVSAILAYSRGFMREVLSIVGWVGAAIAAYFGAPKLDPLIDEFAPSIPVVGEILGDSCELSMLAAFAGVFAIALVIISILIPFFAGAVQRSALGGLDQALGFLFGVLRGAVLVAIALVIYDRVILEDTIEMVDESRTVEVFAMAQEKLNDAIPANAPEWIVGKYEEMMGECISGGSAPAPTAPAEEAPANN
ncbi:MAG: CvpA family protein [Rhodobacteraceae bacterium]|nr:CvpA family protein [Paracoccaceae bacterium]